MSVGTPVLWMVFLGIVAVMLALDLGVFHRRAHRITLREAAIWSAVWITLALSFNGGVWALFGHDKALEFFTGYVIEKSLSIDNIFVFVVIFQYFRVPPEHQHRVLFWGIIGALVTRAVFIFAGSALLHRFHWVMYVFGGVLVITGFRLFVHKDAPMNVEKNPVVRLARRILPTTTEAEGGRMLVREAGTLKVTPLFLTLLTVEFTDVVFAMDSIPAIFAITDDEFIVFTSNIFAILGLRSLYFLLADIVDRFFYLRIGLALVLVFVGVKMLIADVYKLPTLASLGVIVLVLSVSIGASLLRKKQSLPG